MIYTLKNNLVQIDVNDHGAEVENLSYDGLRIIRAKDEIWGRSAPLLFPIVGCLKDGYTVINGTKYFLTKHGFLRDHDWQLLNKESDQITFVDKYSESSLKLYPYKYEAYVTYKLLDKGLKTTIKIKNIDNANFKFNIGGHPGIKCPLFDGDKFNDYKVVFEKEESFSCPMYFDGLWDFNKPSFTFNKIKELDIDYKYFLIDAFVIKNINSRKVSLLNKKNQGISFSFDGFNTLALWTKPNANYLCFEPWCGYDDLVSSNHNYLEKDDLIEIKPGEEKEFSYTIELI